MATCSVRCCFVDYFTKWPEVYVSRHGVPAELGSEESRPSFIVGPFIRGASLLCNGNRIGSS